MLIRRMLCAVLGLALRVFFRRIEIAGLERVPRGGAAIFVVNHPNGLVDPVFILCHAPRAVSFLAKAPIFKMPIVGSLARALDAIPVYRKQDEGADTSQNRETFARSRQLLQRGGTIAICPEGVSHNDTKLRPLKSGAARIALGVVAEDPTLDLKIVPAGLYYTSKTVFRSAALLYFGEPLAVKAVVLNVEGEPPREAVNYLSARIESALRDVTLNVEHEQALATVARAERIFSAAAEDAKEGAPPAPSLARELELRRRFVEGYAFHFQHSPARLAELEARLCRYEEELREAGIDEDDLSAPRATPAMIARYFLTRVAPVLCLFPFAGAGVLINFVAYRLCNLLATKFAQKDDDVVSTFKIAAALLLFPLTWLLLAALCWWLVGWPLALFALVFAPLAGFIAVRFFEQLDNFVGAARAILFFITRRRFFKQLLVERRRLHEEIVALGEEAARFQKTAALTNVETAPTAGHTI
ncbi:MAG: 1-acyl-sn-glycerol-3-phosphate acyltransferase [Pyrinomonadaceae bacterium]|nr:1-acyl-sn-glycerol-3-phosphate acyltransferase [Pyrinomonadaceae bacterium]